MGGESQENQEERFGHHKQNFTHSMFDTMWPPLESHISIYLWKSLALKLLSYKLERLAEYHAIIICCNISNLSDLCKGSVLLGV